MGRSSTRGPLPTRNAGRKVGHRTKASAADEVKAPYLVPLPPLPDRWYVTDAGRKAKLPYHAQAINLYDSFARSGQSVFFEPTDWTQLQVVIGTLSDYLSSARQSAELFKAICAELDKFGTTESARRRMRIEVERPAKGAAPAAATTAAKSRSADRLAAMAAG